jgi:hypothetical protein
MVKSEKTRDEVSETIRKENRKYWPDIAKRIYKYHSSFEFHRLTEDDDLKREVSFPEILNLIDLLCKIEKEFVTLFEENIVSIYKRVYRTVKVKDQNR